MAANMDGTTIKGGQFRYANFTGASIRNIVTERGFVGVGASTNNGWTEYGAGYLYITKDDDPWDPAFGPESTDEVLIRYGLKDNPEADSFLVDFSGATFTAADLRGGHLENSNITQAQVDQACTDQTTILPSKLSARRACNIDNDVDRKRAGFQTGAYRDGAKQCEAGFDDGWGKVGSEFFKPDPSRRNKSRATDVK